MALESETSEGSKVWDLIVPLVEAEGFRVFDIELPSSKSGALRVYIWRGRKENSTGEMMQSGVLLDDCARISKAIDAIVELDEMIPGRYVLEVSSPGVNRKLRRREHLTDAIGERVKVVVDASVLQKGTICGVLNSFDGNKLAMTDEENDETIELPFSSVKRARVEFKFGN